MLWRVANTLLLHSSQISYLLMYDCQGYLLAIASGMGVVYNNASLHMCTHQAFICEGGETDMSRCEIDDGCGVLGDPFEPLLQTAWLDDIQRHAVICCLCKGKGMRANPDTTGLTYRCGSVQVFYSTVKHDI